MLSRDTAEMVAESNSRKLLFETYEKIKDSQSSSNVIVYMMRGGT